MQYVIDCATQGKRRLIRRLASLKTTVNVSDGGEYREDRQYSQVHLASLLDETAIDRWLWKNNFDYVGVVEKN